MYKITEINISGYPCELHETENPNPHTHTPPHYMIRVPFGDTPEDKAMFDSLVYHHKDVYHDEDKDKVIQKVEQFIKNYKKN